MEDGTCPSNSSYLDPHRIADSGSLPTPLKMRQPKFGRLLSLLNTAFNNLPSEKRERTYSSLK